VNIKGSWSQASPGKTLAKPYLKEQTRHGSHNYNPDHVGGDYYVLKLGWSKNGIPYLKYN
jgi:hypothetical protein